MTTPGSKTSHPRLRVRHRTLSITALVGVVVFVSSISGCAATSNESSQPSAAPVDSYPEFIESDRAKLTVFGLSCPLCATNVEKALTSIPGVRSASIDLSSGGVNLLLDPARPIRSTDIARAVKNAGFTLRAIELP